MRYLVREDEVNEDMDIKHMEQLYMGKSCCYYKTSIAFIVKNFNYLLVHLKQIIFLYFNITLECILYPGQKTGGI